MCCWTASSLRQAERRVPARTGANARCRSELWTWTVTVSVPNARGGGDIHQACRGRDLNLRRREDHLGRHAINNERLQARPTERTSIGSGRRIIARTLSGRFAASSRLRLLLHRDSNRPVFEFQTRDSAKLIRVVCSQRPVVLKGDGGDLHVMRADDFSSGLQLLSQAARNGGCFIVERHRSVSFKHGVKSGKTGSFILIALRAVIQLLFYDGA